MNGKQLKDLLGNKIENIAKEIESISKETGMSTLSIGKYGGEVRMDVGTSRSKVYGTTPNSHSFMFEFGHNDMGKHTLIRCNPDCHWCHCEFCKYEHGDKC